MGCREEGHKNIAEHGTLATMAARWTIPLALDDVCATLRLGDDSAAKSSRHASSIWQGVASAVRHGSGIGSCTKLVSPNTRWT